jgi:excisionase family DNA binding protein
VADHDITGEWVGLAEAAKMLGVHPATVRSWADRGYLPSQRTPGGHRRFRLADLQEWMKSQGDTTQAEAQLLVQSAMGRMRLEMGEGNIISSEWYRHLEPAAREQMSLLGRRMMEILQRYLASNADTVLEELSGLASEYAQVIRAQGLTLSQAMQGLFAFQDVIVNAVIQLMETGRGGDVRDDMRKLAAFTRTVILAMVKIYES